jgi:hypothetical protein
MASFVNHHDQSIGQAAAHCTPVTCRLKCGVPCHDGSTSVVVLCVVQDTWMIHILYVRCKSYLISNILNFVTVDNRSYVHMTYLTDSDLRYKILKHWCKVTVHSAQTPLTIINTDCKVGYYLSHVLILFSRRLDLCNVKSVVFCSGTQVWRAAYHHHLHQRALLCLFSSLPFIWILRYIIHLKDTDDGALHFCILFIWTLSIVQFFRWGLRQFVLMDFIFDRLCFYCLHF